MPPKCVHRLGGGAPAVVRDPEIGGDEHRSRAARRRLTGGRRAVPGVHVHHRHPRSAGGELQRDAAADALRGAGHQHHLAAVVNRHRVPSSKAMIPAAAHFCAAPPGTRSAGQHGPGAGPTGCLAPAGLPGAMAAGAPWGNRKTAAWGETGRLTRRAGRYATDGVQGRSARWRRLQDRVAVMPAPQRQCCRSRW